MARPQFVMVWAEAETAAALKARYLREADRHRRQWLQALWLLREGRSVTDTAPVVGANRRSVDRWVDWYRTAGLAGVVAHHQGGQGRAPLLTTDQTAQLADAVATGQFRTAADVGAWITATFAMSLRLRSWYTVLAHARCAPKVPRPQHEPADTTAQEAWNKGGLPTP